MDIKPNTQSLFQSLQPELQQLDEERIKTKQHLRKTNQTWLPLVVIAIGAAFWFGDSYSNVPIYSAFATALVLWVVWHLKTSKIKTIFAKSFKEKVIEKIVQKIDPSFVYSPDSQTHYSNGKDPIVNHLILTSLFPSFSTCKREDVITGTVKDHAFEFSEITLETSGKNRKIVFQGIAIKVLLKNALPSPIYVLPDSANQIRDGLWKLLNLKSKRGEIVMLDHEPFERLFKVYAEDPDLPPKLLRRNILESMVLIHAKIAAVNPVTDAIRISFIENAITISVRLSLNLFEPRLNEPINDLAYFEKNVQYLVLFLGLIADLDLNG